MAFGAISIVVPFIAFIVLIFWVVGISGTPGAQATNVFCLLCIPAFFFGLAAVITGRRRIKASPGDGVGSGAITAGIIGMFACVPLAIIGTLVGFLVVYAATYNGGNGGY
jgi:peptidoglycan/LPS O-acetylase OafA/YrhL